MEADRDPFEDLVGVRLPAGQVKNAGRLPAMFGGPERFQRTLQSESLRMEFNFRPDDDFSVPMYGDKKTAQIVVFKMKMIPKEGDQHGTDETNEGRISKEHSPTKTSNVTSEKFDGVLEDDDMADLKEIPDEELVYDELPATHTHEYICKNRSDVLKSPEHSLAVEPIGICSSLYEFTSMADFQFLPMRLKNGTKGSSGDERDHPTYESLIGKIYRDPMTTFKDYKAASQGPDFVQDFANDVPLLCVPPQFSRKDTPHPFHYRENTFYSDMENSVASFYENSGFVAKKRERNVRANYGKKLKWTEDPSTVPSEPDPVTAANQAIHNSVKTKELILKMKEIYEERPICSKNYLIWRLKMYKHHDQQFKYSLAQVAYFCEGGPWRTMWAKFGYDPRRDTTAAHLQVVSYNSRERLVNKIQMGSGRLLNPNRTIYTENMLIGTRKPEHMLKIGARLLAAAEAAAAASSSEPANVDKKSQRILDLIHARYSFNPPALIPRQAFVFYQLIDVELELVKEILAGPRSETVHPVDGWLPKGSTAKIRDLISNITISQLNKEREEVEAADSSQSGNVPEEDDEDDLTDDEEELLGEEDYEEEELLGIEEEEAMEDLDD